MFGLTLFIINASSFIYKALTRKDKQKLGKYLRNQK